MDEPDAKERDLRDLVNGWDDVANAMGAKAPVEQVRLSLSNLKTRAEVYQATHQERPDDETLAAAQDSVRGHLNGYSNEQRSELSEAITNAIA